MAEEDVQEEQDKPEKKEKPKGLSNKDKEEIQGMVKESVQAELGGATQSIKNHVDQAIGQSNRQMLSKEVLLLQGINQMRKENYLEAVQGDTKPLLKNPAYLKLTIIQILVWAVGLLLSIAIVMAVWLSYDKDPYVSSFGILMLGSIYGVTFISILNTNIRKNFEMQVLKRWIFSLIVPDEEEEQGEVEQPPSPSMQ